MLMTGNEEQDAYEAEQSEKREQNSELNDVLTGKEYWKARCKAAEDYINASPCDPDIYEEQLQAYNKWKKLVEAETS